MRNKFLPFDVIVLFIVIGITLLTLLNFEISEKINQFTAKHEDLELDELILLLAFSSFYMTIFIIRRFLTLKQLLINANTDSLIGITNRRKGTEYIQNEIKGLKSSKYKSSLIMYDLDNFKQVNDVYGHDMGDYVLKEVANIVQNETRNQDFLIWWGGEEFILICPNCDLNDALNLAQRFRSKIENHIFQNDLKITVSFGVTELNKNESLNEQLIRVDKNLYESKETGKNKVTAF